MAWNQFPRVLSGLPRLGHFDPLRELDRIQSEMGRLYRNFSSAVGPREFPPVRIWTGEDGAILVAQLPGFRAEDIDISVTGDTVTLKGERVRGEADGQETWHRNERGHGRFARTFQLPFQVEAGQVAAAFHDGSLEIKLPRAIAERPRKIKITTS